MSILIYLAIGSAITLIYTVGVMAIPYSPFPSHFYWIVLGVMLIPILWGILLPLAIAAGVGILLRPYVQGLLAEEGDDE